MSWLEHLHKRHVFLTESLHRYSMEVWVWSAPFIPQRHMIRTYRESLAILCGWSLSSYRALWSSDQAESVHGLHHHDKRFIWCGHHVVTKIEKLAKGTYGGTWGSLWFSLLITPLCRYVGVPMGSEDGLCQHKGVMDRSLVLRMSVVNFPDE